MIDCEKDCESKVFGKTIADRFDVVPNIGQPACFSCLQRQLRAAEAENTALDKENTLINDRLDFKITELGLHIGKVGEQRSEINYLKRCLVTRDESSQFVQENYEKAYKEIAALKAKVEAPDESLTVCDVRRCDGCSKPFDVCDLNDLADGKMLCDECAGVDAQDVGDYEDTVGRNLRGY